MLSMLLAGVLVDVPEAGRREWQRLHQLQQRYLAVGVADPAGFSTAVRAFSRAMHGGQPGPGWRHASGLSIRQAHYVSVGPRISQQLDIAEHLGHPRKVGSPWCKRIERDWRRWDREHGFDYRCAIGHEHLSDRDRLRAGDEPRPGAPPPPYLELLG
jgi:hypothetical protein